LDSPNWVRIEQAIEHRYKQTESYRLTAEDLNKALRSERQNERLRTLERRADGTREILSFETWGDDLYVSMCWSRGNISAGNWPPYVEGAAVFSRAQGGEQLHGRWLFVWKPDLERLWPRVSEAAPKKAKRPKRKTAQRAVQPAEAPEVKSSE